MAESVCIEDFNGSYHGMPIAFWADWADGVVTFGGDWADVPDMPSAVQPTAEECGDWAVKHGWVLC